MALYTIKFEQIFGVRHGTRTRKEVTFFGFESGAVRQEAVVAPGKPGLNDGDVVTVYLRLPGDWSTVVGWANHTTGELVLEGHREESQKVLAGIVLILAIGSLPLHSTLGSFLILGMIVWVLRAALKKRLIHEARSKLENVLRNRPEIGSISDLGPIRA